MREREAERLQERLANVEERHQAAETEKQQLSTRLQVTEAEVVLVAVDEQGRPTPVKP